jgi:hypothetical protein
MTQHLVEFGKCFEIRLDVYAKENQPLEMVRRSLGSDRGWTHIGHLADGGQTEFIKIVEIGSCQNYNEVLNKLVSHGSIPEGQWIGGLKVRPDSKRMIGFPDATWVNPAGQHCFPYINREGKLCFRRVAGSYGPIWGWVVR